MKFDEFNEADVREEIIGPLIRTLGYQSGTCNKVSREVPLRYKYSFLGRKSERKDISIRGIADYLLETSNSVRWVIEAKPPEPISQNDIEQTFSYANHAEIRAVYFVVCNGMEIVVFQTNKGPSASPILRLSYEEFSTDSGIITLSNLLSPKAIIRDHPSIVADIFPPIGPGLRSFGRIAGGSIVYDKVEPPNPFLSQMQISVIGGSVQRREDGSLIAFVESRAPIRLLDDFLQENKLSIFEVWSSSSSLSVDWHSPTIFRCSMTTVFPAGGVLTNIDTWEPYIIPENWTMDVDFRAEVVLEDGALNGIVHFTSHRERQFLTKASGKIRLNIS